MNRTLLLLLLLPLLTVAQKGHRDTTLIYLDAALEPTIAKKATFQGLSIKVENGWMMYALYADTTPVVKAYYKDKNLTVKQGPYTVYYSKNRKASEGFYHQNKMADNWRYWYENGRLKDSGRIENDHLVGLWKSWHPNGQLISASIFKEEISPTESELLFIQNAGALPPFAGIRSGKFASWYSHGKKDSEGFFKENKTDGDWYWYHPNGAQSTIETYTNGIVTALQCFDTLGKALPDLCSIEAPALLKKYGDYKAFIFENLTWPEEAVKKKIQGDVLVRFQVNRDGKLQNLTIQTSEPILQKAVETLFEQMQEWYPAISHNRVVLWEDEIKIPFRNGNYFTRPVQQNHNW